MYTALMHEAIYQRQGKEGRADWGKTQVEFEEKGTPAARLANGV